MNKVELDFNNLLDKLTNDQFWFWVGEWYDEDYIMGVIKDWDDDTKKREIENLKEILEKKDGK